MCAISERQKVVQDQFRASSEIRFASVVVATNLARVVRWAPNGARSGSGLLRFHLGAPSSCGQFKSIEARIET